MIRADKSPAQGFAELPQAERRAFYQSLTERDARLLLHEWRNWWARPKQCLPDLWSVGASTWLILAGRGFGKTRSGAEAVKELVYQHGYKRIALVGRTAADVRDVMIEGESGLMSIFPDGMKPKYEPSKRRISFSNGAIASTYSAEKPDQLRGPQHDAAWCDEIAAWRDPEAYDQLMFGLRLGDFPITIATTTPKPTVLVRLLVKDQWVLVTTGTTYENANNLAAPALRRLTSKYEGTRLGRQELLAVLMEDTPGALWTQKLIDEHRLHMVVPEDGRPAYYSRLPEMKRIVVAVDPSATSEEGADETGIIVAGLGLDDQGYILDDKSVLETPAEWARAVVRAYDKWKADKIIAEKNNGGDMVSHTIHTERKSAAVKLVWASRGKRTRAEPVSALYEQGRVHHVGTFAELESQMTTWVPDVDSNSPDRMDAMVWAITALMIDDRQFGGVIKLD